MLLRLTPAFLLLLSQQHISTSAFVPCSTTKKSLKLCNAAAPTFLPHRHSSNLYSSPDSEADATPDQEKIGNLVADDEWLGLQMELSEVIRTAVVEDIKKNTSDFIGKDEYKVGDITKEIDSRVKDQIAALRSKDEYELGDLTAAMDQAAKDLTCELTGKDDYEFGDLSKEVDSRVKSTVAEFCGKDEYEFGDLSKEMSKRVESRVLEFTDKGEYEFGDISREIDERRKEWVKDYLGEEAAKRYQFGDLTKKAVTNFTGKDDYEFGDVTKKIVGDFFGKKK